MASAVPTLSTQVIGQAESALGAILDPMLDRAGITFHQWLVLVVASASGGTADRDELTRRIAGARKLAGSQVVAGVDELAAAGLAEVLPAERPAVRLTDAGRALHSQIRGQVNAITSRLFDLPAEDLATAGRVLSVVTARANAEIAAASG